MIGSNGILNQWIFLRQVVVIMAHLGLMWIIDAGLDQINWLL